MDWKQRVGTALEPLLNDPRLTELVTDPRLFRAATFAMNSSAKLAAYGKHLRTQLARTLGFATDEEVQELREAVRRLEQALWEPERHEQHNREGSP